MARTIGRLSVGIGGNTAGLRRAIGGARGMLRGFASDKAFRRVAVGAAAGVGLLTASVAGAAIGVKAFVDQEFAAIDATAKFADRIGVGTRELSGLHHAGDLTGVTAKNLDLGLQRMTRRIAEAAGGTGEAKNAIKQLGLEAEALSRMSPDEQFLAVADAMREVEGRGNKVRLAFKLFDAEGVGLINTLDLGSEGLRETIREAERLGIAFDRVDAAQIEAANDAITRMQAVWTGVKRTIAIELAPYIEAVASRISALGADGGALTAIVIDGVEGVTKAFAQLVSTMAPVARYVIRTRRDLVEGFRLDDTDKIASNNRRLLSGGLGDDQKMALRARNAELREANRKALLEVRELDELLEAMSGDALSARNIGAFFEKIRDEARGAAESVAAARSAEAAAGAHADAGPTEAMIREAERLNAALRSPAEVFADTARRLDELRANDLISAERHAAGLARAAAERDQALRAAFAGNAPAVDAELEAMRARADAVLAGIRTPEERFAAEFHDLERLRDADLLDQEQYVRALRQARGRALASYNGVREPAGPERVGDAFVGRLSRLASVTTPGAGSPQQNVGGPVLERIEAMLDRIVSQGVDARMKKGA